MASYPVPGSGSPKAEYTGAADGFEVEGNLKDKRKRFILRCGFPFDFLCLEQRLSALNQLSLFLLLRFLTLGID